MTLTAGVKLGPVRNPIRSRRRRHGHLSWAGAWRNPGRTYDISPDGQRFLLIKEGGGSEKAAAPITLTWSNTSMRN
jgi:hypothetical protein